MTSERAFFDTNVFVYAFGDDDRRRAVARRVVDDGGTISPQVLNELVNVLRARQRKNDLYIARCLDAIRSAFEVMPMTADAQAAAFGLSTRHSIHIYDAMILATAAEAGCTVLLSEDLGHGEHHLGVRVENPFRTA
jgi:predicted nucleic acid-binding protein